MHLLFTRTARITTVTTVVEKIVSTDFHGANIQWDTLASSPPGNLVGARIQWHTLAVNEGSISNSCNLVCPAQLFSKYCVVLAHSFLVEPMPESLIINVQPVLPGIILLEKCASVFSGSVRGTEHTSACARRFLCATRCSINALVPLLANVSRLFITSFLVMPVAESVQPSSFCHLVEGF